MGRLLLAYAPDLESLQAAEEGASSPSNEAKAMDEQLSAELSRIREKGFAIANQVHVEGQRCVAAPLRSRSGEVIAAVDVSAPKSAFSKAETLEQLLPLVLTSAREMSTHLGYKPAP